MKTITYIAPTGKFNGGSIYFSFKGMRPAIHQWLKENVPDLKHYNSINLSDVPFAAPGTQYSFRNSDGDFYISLSMDGTWHLLGFAGCTEESRPRVLQTVLEQMLQGAPKAQFLHPHCPHPNDPKRAALWWALLQEHWMTTDEMIAVVKRVESNAPLAYDRYPSYNKRTLGAKMNDAIEDVMDDAGYKINYMLHSFPQWEWLAMVYIPIMNGLL